MTLPQDNDRLNLAQAISNVAMKSVKWTFFWGPATLVFLGYTLYLSISYRPVTTLFSLPYNALEALILDLALGALPLVLLVALYLRRHKADEAQERLRLLADFEGKELVIARYNRNAIYQVLHRDPQTGALDLRLVWTAEGRTNAPKVYAATKPDAVEPLTERWVNEGIS